MEELGGILQVFLLLAVSGISKEKDVADEMLRIQRKA